MTILRDISVVWSLMHVLVLFTFLYEPRLPKKKVIILTCVTMLPWLALNGMLYVLLEELAAQALLATATVSGLLFFYFMSAHRDGRFFFTFCFVGTIAYSIILITSMMDYYLFGNRYIFMLVSRLLIFSVAEVIALKKYLNGLYRELQHTVKRGWGVFALVSALFYVLLVLMSSYPVLYYENPGQTPKLVLVLILMVLMYYNIFQVLSNQQKVFYAMEEERRINQQAQLLRAELEVERQYVEATRRYRHDLHHHGKVIYECLLRGEVEEAKSYLKIYRQELEEIAPQTYCSEPVVNALLRMTHRRCTASGIEFHMEGDIPKGIILSEPECGTVFGNLLENACEACEKTRNGKLSIRAESRKGTLYVEIRNSVSGKAVFDRDRPLSTKENGGIGLRSVIGVLDKYDGMIGFRQEGSQFITRLILPN